MFGNVLDPTGGFLAGNGAVTVGWNLTPNGYTAVRASLLTGDFGSGNRYAMGFLPDFALALYQAFYDARVLVWAGELSAQWDNDLALWRTAPGSPTPYPPQDTTDAGRWAATEAGWQKPVI
ncbi:hypothetical protein FJ656_02720 [Schumannella luteola]|nr:hypothetical protein FJ656_02720 [Schumannella luteola]